MSTKTKAETCIYNANRFSVYYEPWCIYIQEKKILLPPHVYIANKVDKTICTKCKCYKKDSE